MHDWLFDYQIDGSQVFGGNSVSHAEPPPIFGRDNATPIPPFG